MRRFVFPMFQLLFVSASCLTAQLPGNSARALGVAGAYDLSARGFEATTWNPAMLGMPGGPAVSVGLPQGVFEFGSNAYGLGDLFHYANVKLNAADKQSLLGRIDSTLDLRMVAQVNTVGVSFGRVALSVSSAGQASVGIGKDAVELALDGNSNRDGPGQFFSAAHSRGDAWAVTTIALGYRFPIHISAGRLAVGATIKRMTGQGLARAEELSSRLQVDPSIQVHGSGHAIYTTGMAGGAGDFLFGGNAPGHGYGLDIGGVLALPSGITVGAVVVNAIATMRWDERRLRYERASYDASPDSTGAIVDTLVTTTLTGAGINADPVARAFRDSLLTQARFTKLARASVSWHTGRLILAANGMVLLAQGLDQQPARSVALGAEYLVKGFLPLRAGIGSDFSDSFTMSVGAGVNVGPVRFDLGAASLSGTAHPGVRVGAGLSLWFGGLRGA